MGEIRLAEVRGIWLGNEANWWQPVGSDGAGMVLQSCYFESEAKLRVSLVHSLKNESKKSKSLDSSKQYGGCAMCIYVQKLENTRITLGLQPEVKYLLRLMVHSLHSHKEW
jgi:hypothetical protein